MQTSALQYASATDLYDRLLQASEREPADLLLVRIVSSWLSGNSVLPQWIGLQEYEYHALMASHFPAFPYEDILPEAEPILAERVEEVADLKGVLLKGRSGKTDRELHYAGVLAAACMGSDHLWQDLGLANRAELSLLMAEYFQPLKLKNNKDMKWKKFLYKQLCEAEGIYICRAPSCEVCKDYDLCFGPEE